MLMLPTNIQIKNMINNAKQNLKESDLDIMRLANTHQDDEFCQGVFFRRKYSTAIFFSKFQAKLLTK
jgi:hypothetical protein